MKFRRKKRPEEPPVIIAQIVYKKGSMTMAGAFEYTGRTIEEIFEGWQNDYRADRLVRLGKADGGAVILPARSVAELTLTIKERA